MATAVKTQEELAQQGIDTAPQQNVVDMGTILGTLFGVLLIFGAILYQGDVGLFWSIPSALIVFGGTVTTALMHTRPAISGCSDPSQAVSAPPIDRPTTTTCSHRAARAR